MRSPVSALLHPAALQVCDVLKPLQLALLQLFDVLNHLQVCVLDRCWDITCGLRPGTYCATRPEPAASTAAAAAQHSSVLNPPTPATLPREVQVTLAQAWRLRLQLLSDLWSLAAVPVCFAAFVAVNGGIVVGDKLAHAPVRHTMQPLYFALFANLGLAPVLLAPSR